MDNSKNLVQSVNENTEKSPVPEIAETPIESSTHDDAKSAQNADLLLKEDLSSPPEGCTFKTNKPVDEKKDVVCKLENSIRIADPVQKKVFINTVVKKFDQQRIYDKILILDEYRKTHQVKDELAFLMSALVKDYQPPAAVYKRIQRDAAKAEFLAKMPPEERLLREKMKTIGIPESYFNFCVGASDKGLREIYEWSNRKGIWM